MKTTALLCLLGTFGATLWSQGQDPQKPRAESAAPTVKNLPPTSPLEGVYELRSRTIDGKTELYRARGYVAITKRHMLVCFVAPGPDPDLPLLRAGVRSWQPDKDALVRTEFKLGFYTDEKGRVHVEPPGNVEIKRIDVERGRLRIWQDDKSHLEFERIE
jgi:hypothetical protein